MEKTIVDYLQLIRSKLLWIGLFVALSCIVTVYVGQSFVKPVYEAKSKILVNSSFKESGNMEFNDVMMNLNLIESYKEILKSSNVLDKVVENHPEFGLTAERLGKKLKVTSADKTQIINIQAEDADYGKAVMIVNAVAQTFIRDIPSLMNMDNVSLMSAADPGKRPAPANAGIVTNIAVSFMLSLIVALGAVFFAENLNNTIRSEKEAEHYIGLPVMATIGTIRKSGMKRRTLPRDREVGEKSYVTAE